MAQTIAEKLAEKYDVTPSTTIAGTLKKITNDETGDVNIVSLVSKMEAGGAIHQTYEGTVANIMQQIPNFSAFAKNLFNGSAFARLTATLGTDTATLTVVSNEPHVVQASVQFLSRATSGITAMQTFIGQWGSRGTLNVFEEISNASDLTWTRTNYAPTASQVPCVLEVVQFDILMT